MEFVDNANGESDANYIATVEDPTTSCLQEGLHGLHLNYEIDTNSNGYSSPMPQASGECGTPMSSISKPRRSAPRLPPNSASSDQATSAITTPVSRPTRTVHRPPPTAIDTSLVTTPTAGPKSDIFDFVPLVSPRPKMTPSTGVRSAPSSASSVFSGSNEGDDLSDDESPYRPKQAISSKRIPRRDSFRFMNSKQQNKRHSLSKGIGLEDMVYDRTIVLDMGSYYMRAGFAGDETPIAHFRNVVSQKPREATAVGPTEYFVGDDALIHTVDDISQRSVPYSNGNVHSWDQLEALWDFCFEDLLHADTPSSNVFLTETHLPPRAVRESTLETMFELFDVKGLFLHVQPPLAMYAAGKLTGCVVDSGHMSTSVFPISEGFQIANACIKTAHGGHHLTNLLMSMLLARDIINGNNAYKSLLSAQQGRSVLDVARYIKESYAFVEPAFSPMPLFHPEDDEEYLLPDGNTILIGKELARTGEAMFHPVMSQDLFDLEEERPLQQIVLDSIKSCSLELRKNLLSNIVLCGGNSHIPGMRERLMSELKAIVPSSVDVTIPRGGDDAVWIGGSILANLSVFQNHWITSEEYREGGPQVVHELCPVHM